jgi:hypothetical protein
MTTTQGEAHRVADATATIGTEVRSTVARA